MRLAPCGGECPFTPSKVAFPHLEDEWATREIVNSLPCRWFSLLKRADDVEVQWGDGLGSDTGGSKEWHLGHEQPIVELYSGGTVKECAVVEVQHPIDV